jgi:predicted transcriptional regulator
MSTIGLQKNKATTFTKQEGTEKGLEGIQESQFVEPSVLNEYKTAKRDRIQILLQMLEVANVPTKKTHLMYGGGINYYQLEKHLGLLLQLDMVEEVQLEDGIAYRTTESGRQFCQLFNSQTIVSDMKRRSML